MPHNRTVVQVGKDLSLVYIEHLACAHWKAGTHFSYAGDHSKSFLVGTGQM